MNNIHLYRKALIYTKELSKLESSMQTAISEIEAYKKYIPAQECIETLSRNLTIVQVHLEHQKKIVKNKGAKE